MVNKKQLNRNVRRKVIFVFISCCVALGLAWTISKEAFNEVLTTVNNISKPNEKMRLVSQVSRDIMRLDQLQKNQVLIENNDSYKSFQDESALVSRTLDSLKNLYSQDNGQINRIDSIKILLTERDKLFKSYIKVRGQMVDSHEFSQQLQTIGDILQNSAYLDSTIVTSQQRTRTEIIEPSKSINQDTIINDDRSFFAKLFGAKRKVIEQPARVELPRKKIEELNTLIDTITTARQDSATKLIDSLLKQIEETQRAQSTSFIDREVELTYAGNLLISKMLTILNEVEKEGMMQVENEHLQAQSLMNDSIKRINWVVVGFFGITAVLVLLILSDIRQHNRYRIELEVAKEEAEYHSAAKQRFLSNMSHELRTPLQSIIGYAEQLRDEHPEDSRKVNVIYQSSEHLLQIVNEVLDYNRINSGKFQFNNLDFDLLNLIDEVVSAMQLQSEEKGLQLHIIKDVSGSGYIYGDPFRIKQILYNLLSNAIKFTEKGSVSLFVGTVVEGDVTKLKISIKDTGKGIPKDDIHRIFNEFEQAQNSNSGVHFGSGLGLSIVKTLCEAMNGTVEIHSEINVGSQFDVFIPLKTSTVTKSAENDQDLLPINDFDGTIWVVDDDDFILELCHNIFNKYSIRHRTFSSPDEILNTPWDPSVSILLMDMRMPGKTGVELNHELKPRIAKHVKTYAFTAQALPEEREQILSQGFDGLLLKPFKEQNLLNLLGLRKPKEAIKFTQHHTFKYFDFTNLRKMTLNDPQQLLRVLQLFIKDTSKDLIVLRNALQADARDDMALICHKLAGRTAQMGGQKLSIKLRKLEIDIRSNEPLDILEIQSVIDQLYRLMDYLKEEIHGMQVSSAVSIS